jgi:hypothetical protein
MMEQCMTGTIDLRWKEAEDVFIYSQLSMRLGNSGNS